MNQEDMSIFDDVIDNEGVFTDNPDLLPYDVENEDDTQHFDDEEDNYTFDGMAQLPTIEDDEDDDTSDDQPHQQFTDNKLINDVLASKGIVNHTIHYEGADGSIEDVDFYSLPHAEQIAILNSNDKDLDYGLDDEELEAVNFLRENDATLDEVVDYFKRQAVQEYIDGQNIAGIEVNQYSDEQLFALDLKAKYEDLTDDEIAIEIEKQLEHPELFKKKVDKLRTDYKELEIAQLQQARVQQESDEQSRFEDLQENLITVAQSVEDIGGLDLDNNDKNEILAYILEKDINGVSPFIKSLDSPENLFELAWYATKGKEAFGIIHDYYKKQIDSVRKTSYDKGRTEATSKAAPGQPNRKTFVRDSGSKPQPQNKILHIDNLEID